jgi:predicted ribosome quality control (RQC) complex YloA/Tae2 family protein
LHNNFYFLRQLTPALETMLRHTVVSECFSQNREELIIRFETTSTAFFIKASLQASFSCLSFPEIFHRARKNSVDLFSTLIGQRVLALRQFENERSFSIQFTNQVSLLFKLHGNRSNVVLFNESRVIQIFKNSIIEDEKINIETLDRTIDWSYECFLENHDKLESLYFTFGKIVWKYLEHLGLKKLPLEKQWKVIQQVREELQAPNYSIRDHEGKIFFSLLSLGNAIKPFDDPIKAIHEFFLFHSQQDAFTKEKSKAVSFLKSNLRTIEANYEKAQHKLLELERDNNYKVWADLLMANMHLVNIGTERIVLPSFYNENHPIEIKLKKDLSAQKNASLFYKKAKNQQIEIDYLKKLLGNKKKEKENLTNKLQQIESATDLKSLKKWNETLSIKEQKKQAAPLPYREFEFNGYKIWVGKSAESNDTLTLKFGYKEDLWLHAKDVAGSHVLIKHQAGKNFPKDVIERAAQLAAYYSKRKNETLCPVSVTQRKYVRKRKGDPAGAVVVEREEVVMVVPTAGEVSGK